MVQLAVDIEGVAPPHERDVAVDFDRGIVQAFLEPRPTGFQARDELVHRAVDDFPRAIRRLGRDRQIAVGVHHRPQPLAIARGNRGEDGVDGGHHLPLLACGRGEAGAFWHRLHRGYLGEEGEEDHDCPSNSSPSLSRGGGSAKH